MGAIGCHETSVRNYLSRLRYNPEERRSHRQLMFLIMRDRCLTHIKQQIFGFMYFILYIFGYQTGRQKTEEEEEAPNDSKHAMTNGIKACCFCQCILCDIKFHFGNSEVYGLMAVTLHWAVEVPYRNL
jgi:hypothetical protein